MSQIRRFFLPVLYATLGTSFDGCNLPSAQVKSNPAIGLTAARFGRYGVAIALSALLLVAGCSSSGGRYSPECAPRKGMRAEILVRCGCFPARSGGGSVMIQGYDQNIAEAITLVHYICPRGKGNFDRVAVVNGVVDRVIY